MEGWIGPRTMDRGRCRMQGRGWLTGDRGRETGDGRTTGDRGRETGEEWKDGRLIRWNVGTSERLNVGGWRGANGSLEGWRKVSSEQ
jgi:hypothetical protein